MENNIANIGVYSITSPSGKKYVGMTTDCFKNRWTQHRKLLRAGHHTCFGLQNAYNKYGLDNLIFEIVKEYEKPADKASLITLKDNILFDEVYYWEFYNNQGIQLYNGKPTGTGSVFHTEETKQKQRDAALKNVDNFVNLTIGENKELTLKKCRYCYNSFTAKSNFKLYCSHRCRVHYLRNNSSLQYVIFPSKDKLTEQYEKNKDIEVIAKYFGCNKYDIKFLLAQHMIVPNIQQYTSNQGLIKKNNKSHCQYCEKEFSIVNKSLSKYCSETCRKEASKPKKDYTERPTKELFQQLYVVEGFSTTQIAEKLNCTQPNVYYLLKKFNIPK